VNEEVVAVCLIRDDSKMQDLSQILGAEKSDSGSDDSGIAITFSIDPAVL
jgi:hypothetical protein